MNYLIFSVLFICLSFSSSAGIVIVERHVTIKSYSGHELKGEFEDGTRVTFGIDKLDAFYRDNLHLYLNKKIPVKLKYGEYQINKTKN